MYINIVRVAGGGQMNNCPVNQRSYSILRVAIICLLIMTTTLHNLMSTHVRPQDYYAKPITRKQPETMLCWLSRAELRTASCCVVALFGAHYTYLTSYRKYFKCICNVLCSTMATYFTSVRPSFRNVTLDGITECADCPYFPRINSSTSEMKIRSNNNAKRGNNSSAARLIRKINFAQLHTPSPSSSNSSGRN